MNIVTDCELIHFKCFEENKFILYKLFDRVGQVEDIGTLKTFKEVVLTQERYYVKRILDRVLSQTYGFSRSFARHWICDYYDEMVNYYKVKV